MFSGRTVVNNIFWLSLTPFLRMLIAIPLAGFVAHKLGVQGYGEFNFATSFVVLFGVAANLGVNEVLVRTVAQRASDLSRLWWNAMALKVILLALYVGIAGGAATILGYPSSMIVLVVVMAIYQGLMSVLIGAASVFSGHQALGQVSRVGTIQLLAEVAATVSVLAAGGLALQLAESRVVVEALGVVVLVSMTFRWFSLQPTRLSWPEMSRLLRPGLRFAVIALFRAINLRAGVLLLERVRGVGEVALLSAALGPVERLFSVLPAVTGAIFPFFSALRAREDARFASSVVRAFRYQCLLGFGAGVAMSLAGPVLLRLIFPAGFRGAGLVMETLGIVVALRSLNVVVGTALLARGNERAVGWAALAQCTVSIGVSALAVGPLGADGVAWAMVASEGVALGVHIVLLKRSPAIERFPLRPLTVCALVAGGIFAALRLGAGGERSALLLIGLAAAYPLLIVMGRVLSAEDLEYVRRLFRGPRQPTTAGPAR
jgi:PST family polysaccharide transporter